MIWEEIREKLPDAARLAVIAAGALGWAWMIWSISHYVTRSEIEATYASRDYAERADQQIREECARRPVEAAMECAAKVVSASHESQRAEQNLDAQRQTAFFTMFMAWLAAGGLTASIVGIYLVYLTFRETRVQTEGFAINSERQLRAYLDFDGVEFLRDPASDVPGLVRSGVTIKVRNYGHTPASGVAMKIAYLINDPETAQPRWIVSEDKEVSMIAPTDHHTSNSEFDIPGEVWTALKLNRTRMRVDILVAYTDEFERPHTLDSAFESNGLKPFGAVQGTRRSS